MYKSNLYKVCYIAEFWLYSNNNHTSYLVLGQVVSRVLIIRLSPAIGGQYTYLQKTDLRTRKGCQMDERLPRKLAAILYADVDDYSRLIGSKISAAQRQLTERFTAYFSELISELLARWSRSSAQCGQVKTHGIQGNILHARLSHSGHISVLLLLCQAGLT